MYKLVDQGCVFRISDNAYIPFATGNKDYALYQEWIAAGNTPIPADQPSLSIPISVTPRQAKLALLSAGLLDDVEAAIDAITDPATKRVAQIEWEYAQEIRRDWPFLVQLATAMGMTSTDLDELFTQAALL